MAASKTTCPVSRPEFAAGAKPITLDIDGRPFYGAPKEMSTGSLGWNINEKVTMKIGDKLVTCQLGVNLIVVGSKDLPK